MKTFRQLLEECIAHEASYFRDGSKKQEVIEYVEALELEIAQLKTQIESQSDEETVDEEIPVLVELVAVETESPAKMSDGPEYEIVIEYREKDGEKETFAPRHRITARNFNDANAQAHSIRDREYWEQDARIVSIAEVR